MAGVDFGIVSLGATQSQTVTALHVAAMSVFSGLAGALLLRATKRWAPRSWSVLAALGLLVGVISMPLLAEADLGTKLSLAAMHLVCGGSFFAATRRELRQ